MTDRERRDMRGPVQSVIWETFGCDTTPGAVSEKPSRREELTFSPQGNLLEDISQYQGGPIQRSTYVHDEAGRLRETTWHHSDGTEGSAEVKYDPYGQPIQSGANVTYSSDNGRKIKPRYSSPKPPAWIEPSVSE